MRDQDEILLNGVDSDLADRYRTAKQKVRERTGVSLSIAGGGRSRERQQKYFEEGKTPYDGNNPNAPHPLGLALDLNWKRLPSNIQSVAEEELRNVGLRQGGRLANGYSEKHHWQLPAVTDGNHIVTGLDDVGSTASSGQKSSTISDGNVEIDFSPDTQDSQSVSTATQSSGSIPIVGSLLNSTPRTLKGATVKRLRPRPQPLQSLGGVVPIVGAEVDKLTPASRIRGQVLSEAVDLMNQARTGLSGQASIGDVRRSDDNPQVSLGDKQRIDEDISRQEREQVAREMLAERPMRPLTEKMVDAEIQRRREASKDSSLVDTLGNLIGAMPPPISGDLIPTANGPTAIRQGFGETGNRLVREGALRSIGGTAQQLGNAGQLLGLPSSEAAQRAGQVLQRGVQKSIETHPSTSAAGAIGSEVVRGISGLPLEYAKLVGGSPLGAANLPIQGALSADPNDPNAMATAAIKGLGYHYGMQATAPLGQALNGAVWTAVPTVEGRIEGKSWAEALGSSLPMGLLAATGESGVQARERFFREKGFEPIVIKSESGETASVYVNPETGWAVSRKVANEESRPNRPIVEVGKDVFNNITGGRRINIVKGSYAGEAPTVEPAGMGATPTQQPRIGTSPRQIEGQAPPLPPEPLPTVGPGYAMPADSSELTSTRQPVNDYRIEEQGGKVYVVDPQNIPDVKTYPANQRGRAAAIDRLRTLSEQSQPKLTASIGAQLASKGISVPAQPAPESVSPVDASANTPEQSEGNVAPKTIIRHADPRIDGGEIVGRTSDGKLKVQNNAGGISTVQNPRTQGNKNAAIQTVREGNSAAENPTPQTGSAEAGSQEVAPSVQSQGQEKRAASTAPPAVKSDEATAAPVLTSPKAEVAKGEHGHLIQALFKSPGTTPEGDTIQPFLAQPSVRSALGLTSRTPNPDRDIRGYNDALKQAKERLAPSLGKPRASHISPDDLRTWANERGLPAQAMQALDYAVAHHENVRLKNEQAKNTVEQRIESTKQRLEKPKEPTNYQRTGVRRNNFDPSIHSLSEAIRRLGGVEPDSVNKGEAKRLSNKESGSSGLIRKGGLSAERMAERLWEEGYYSERPDPNQILSDAEEDLSGTRKHYSTAHQPDYEKEYYDKLPQSVKDEFAREMALSADPRVVQSLEEVRNGQEDEGLRQYLYDIAAEHQVSESAVNAWLDYARSLSESVSPTARPTELRAANAPSIQSSNSRTESNLRRPAGEKAELAKTEPRGVSQPDNQNQRASIEQKKSALLGLLRTRTINRAEYAKRLSDIESGKDINIVTGRALPPSPRQSEAGFLNVGALIKTFIFDPTRTAGSTGTKAIENTVAYIRAALLSNIPATPIKAAISLTAKAAIEEGVRPLSSLIDRAASRVLSMPRVVGGWHGRAMSESFVKTLKMGLPDAWKIMRGQTPQTPGAHNFPGVRTRFPLFDASVNTVTRIYGAKAAIFYTRAYYSEITQQAILQADKMIKSGQLTRGNRKQFIDQFINTPPPQSQILASQIAMRNIYMNENLASDITSGMKKGLTKAIPGMGRLIGHAMIPIDRVPSNAAIDLIFSQPIIGHAKALFQWKQAVDFMNKALTTTNPRLAQDFTAAARVAQHEAAQTFAKASTIGALFILVGAMLAARGDAVSDKYDKRVRVPGTDYTASLIPFGLPGMLTGLGASMYQNMKGKDLSGMWEGLKASEKEALRDIPVIRELSDLASEDKSKPKPILDSAARLLIPQGIQSIGNLTDDVKRTPQTNIQAIEARLPVLRRNVPASKYPEDKYKLFDPFKVRKEEGRSANRASGAPKPPSAPRPIRRTVN